MDRTTTFASSRHAFASTFSGRRAAPGGFIAPVFAQMLPWVACLAGLLAVGCGEPAPDGPDTAPVSGIVTLDDQPVDGAKVFFRPVKSGVEGKSAEAITTADGSFEVQTHIGKGHKKPGIVPGEYYITVVKLDTSAAAQTGMPRHMLPQKYANAKTSGLSTKIVAGQENDVPLKLSSQ